MTVSCHRQDLGFRFCASGAKMIPDKCIGFLRSATECEVVTCFEIPASRPASFSELLMC